MRLAGMAAFFVIARAYLGSQNGVRVALVALALTGTACAGLGMYQTLSSQTVLGLGIYGPYQSLVPVESLAEPDQALIYRAAGPFRHPNELGLFLTGCLAFTFGLLGRPRSWFLRLALTALAGLQAMTLLYTYSRSAWLGAALVIAGFLVFSPRRRLVALSALGAVVVGLALLPPEGREALGQRSGRAQPYDVGRVDSWRAAARMAWHHPLTGIGLGSFAERFPEFKDPEARLDPRQRHDAHNAFLSLAAEAGLPAGLALAFGVVFSLALGLNRVRRTWQEVQLPTGCSAALIGLLPVLLLNSFQYEELFWLVLAWNQTGGPDRARDAWLVRVPGRTPWRLALVLAALAALALGAFYGRVQSVRDLAGRALAVANTPLGRAPSARPRLYFDEAGLARLRERACAVDAPEFHALRDRADYLAGQPFSVCDTNHLRDLARSIPPCALAFRFWDRAPDLQQARGRALRLATRLDPATAEDLETAEALYALALARDWLHDQWTDDERSRLLACIERGAGSLARQIFYYPPAGNHRIVDAACLAVAGLGCYGDTPAAESWIRLGHRELERAAAFLGPDGLSPEGLAYASYSLEHILKFQAAAEPLLGLPLHPESWARAFPAAFLHQSVARDYWRPDNLLVSFADSPRQVWNGPGHLFARLATLTREPLDQWLAARFLLNALDEGSGTWLYALWYQPAPPIPFPAGLPLHRYAQDAGLYLARDSWSGRETVFGFTCRPAVGRRLRRGGFAEPGLGHAQPDANSFVLAVGGDHLVTHPGPTTRKLTRLHNTILVNGRGQAGEGGAWLDPAAALAVRPPPDIIRAEHTDLYDYVAGDASAAYLDPDLARFVRHVFWLRPGLLVLLDDLEARRPATFDWLLHTEGEVIREAPDTLLIRRGQAAMRLRFVWPREVVLAVETGPNPYADPMWGVREWTTIRATPGQPSARETILAVMSLARDGADPAVADVIEDAAGATIPAAAGPAVRIQTRPELLLRLAAGSARP
jgi:O-antigen ligase